MEDSDKAFDNRFRSEKKRKKKGIRRRAAFVRIGLRKVWRVRKVDFVLVKLKKD